MALGGCDAFLVVFVVVVDAVFFYFFLAAADGEMFHLLFITFHDKLNL